MGSSLWGGVGVKTLYDVIKECRGEGEEVAGFSFAVSMALCENTP